MTQASAFVVSLDMALYGGLVASRVPGLSAGVAYARMRNLGAFRESVPRAYFAAFGTVMRLAPTGVPALSSTAKVWATGATVDAIAAYANLPSPLQTDAQRSRAERLREQIGAPLLQGYLSARTRNRNVDEFALQVAAESGFNRIVLGQDDAGPTGIHLADLAALERARRADDLGARASIEPGADELGMALVAAALAHDARWVPSIRVQYSRPQGGRVVDPLEYAPIDATITRLIGVCGARRVETADADIDLFVRVGATSGIEESAFVDAIAQDVARGRSVTVSDLTFLAGKMPSLEQQELVQTLVARGLAGKLDGFAAWNTNANTNGTALAVAIAAGVGRRTGRYDAVAHAEFMLDRFADDFAFHQFVRPILNESLRADGINPTLLEPALAERTAARNRALLWPQALELLSSIYPQYRDAGLTITLPWQRTFETMLDVRLTAR